MSSGDKHWDVKLAEYNRPESDMERKREKGSASPATAQRKPVFTFKCVFCQAQNETSAPPDDNMLGCKSCGYPTPQTLDKVKR